MCITFPVWLILSNEKIFKLQFVQVRGNIQAVMFKVSLFTFNCSTKIWINNYFSFCYCGKSIIMSHARIHGMETFCAKNKNHLVLFAAADDKSSAFMHSRRYHKLHNIL